DYYVQAIPFRLEFSIKSRDREDNLLSEVKGEFFIKNKNSFYVEYPGEEILYDGKWLWTYNKHTDQIVVEEFDPTSSLNLIYDVINGDLESYQINKTQKTDQFQEIFLEPKGDSNFFKKFKIVVPQDTTLIDHLQYVDFQSNQILINFLQIGDSLLCDSSFYDIKNMEEKELIDLRP
ncbi:MAG: outer membrane lipoprotein carrier protein LolA, partial [Candidatus Marinimicrobia bacterium]|nr:outer membrane lipoprotein carrier protein LolA [Candidatus Neomarinimicrobiota bacterium]